MEAACRVPRAEQGLASPLAGPSLEPREGQHGVTPLVFPPVSPSPCWLRCCPLLFYSRMGRGRAASPLHPAGSTAGSGDSNGVSITYHPAARASLGLARLAG